MPALLIYRRRRYLLDLGSGCGKAIKEFMQKNHAVEHELQIHAFEPNPAHHPKLRAALAQIKSHSPAILHEAAAWVSDEQVCLSVSRLWPSWCLEKKR